MSSQPVTGQQIEASYGITAASFEAMDLATRALFRAAYACDVLHVQEVPKGSNRGPDVERYQAAAGSGPGEPWCASFACSNLLDSGAKRSDLPDNPASVHSWLDWAIDGGNHSQTPERSDFGLIIETTTTGHLVQVSAVDEDARTVETVEGNTNDDGSSEGYGVFRRTRPWSDFHTFVKLGGLG